MIDTTCTECHSKLSVAADLQGSEVRCPRCDGVFRVTVESENPQNHALSETTPPGGIAPSAVEGVPPVAVGQAATDDVNVGSLASESHAETADLRMPAFFLRIPEGMDFGPVARNELDSWVEEGRVASDCRLRREDQDEWVLATEVYEELAEDGNPFGTQVATPPQTVQPHRAPFLFALSIAGCVLPFISFWPAVMGTRDLHLMNQGKMDPTGDPLTRAGQAIAMVSSMVWVGAFAIGLLYLLVRLMTSL